MTFIYKTILAFIVVQVALVLAKPYKHEYDDGLYRFNGKMENFVYKREEEFKCYSCQTDSEDNCERNERVCKQQNPICMTVKGSTAYILQCADNDYYNKSKEYCDKPSNACQVSSCNESLCN